ncbi:lytic transglycosylase, catalytic [Nitrospirillum viridazoti Y2]|uniref:Transglycosylase-like protein with SLT domain n=1 Tax=Nitrospirillum amazonense TaxID=28077 RepID=A0A560HL06_9PROT|nr:lytic transglycosylase domain-containing protein [Nitrospirillum amazonense]EGY00084.1 lytic transglycosylase, catalytic [Nitrospirillum amazonense Y2]TWB46631.1 transglycosylase-like protein with SLT domain [Nitrospirillum amazonense]
MPVLTLAAACGLATASPLLAPLQPPPPCMKATAHWQAGIAPEVVPEITEAAARFNLPPSLLTAVVAVESAGNPAATSPAGAMGLTQLMPGTWANLRARLHLGASAYQVRDNLLAGAALLADLRERFGPVDALAAYNAGPGRVLAHYRTGQPLPTATQRYVAQVLGRWTQAPREPWAQEQGLFVVRSHAERAP